MLAQQQVKGNERLVVVTSVPIGSLVVTDMEKHEFPSLGIFEHRVPSQVFFQTIVTMLSSFSIPQLFPFVKCAFKN